MFNFTVFHRELPYGLQATLGGESVNFGQCESEHCSRLAARKPLSTREKETNEHVIFIYVFKTAFAAGNDGAQTNKFTFRHNEDMVRCLSEQFSDLLRSLRLLLREGNDGPFGQICPKGDGAVVAAEGKDARCAFAQHEDGGRRFGGRDGNFDHKYTFDLLMRCPIGHFEHL